MDSPTPIERTAFAILIAGTAWLTYVAWDLKSQHGTLQRALHEGSLRVSTIEDAILKECREEIHDRIAYAVREAPTDDVHRLTSLAKPLAHIDFVRGMRKALYDVAGLPFDGDYAIRRLEFHQCLTANVALGSVESRASYVHHLNDILEKK